MGGIYRRKKVHRGDRPLKEKYRTRRKTKDLDQIQDDLKPDKAVRLLTQEVDHDVAGSAQHYCIHCAKYCISSQALEDHFRGKPHKRRMKALETEAYTQAEAERAAGMGSYVPAKKMRVETYRQEAMDAAAAGSSGAGAGGDASATAVAASSS